MFWLSLRGSTPPFRLSAGRGSVSVYLQCAGLGAYVLGRNRKSRQSRPVHPRASSVRRRGTSAGVRFARFRRLRAAQPSPRHLGSLVRWLACPRGAGPRMLAGHHRAGVPVVTAEELGGVCWAGRLDAQGSSSGCGGMPWLPFVSSASWSCGLGLGAAGWCLCSCQLESIRAVDVSLSWGLERWGAG